MNDAVFFFGVMPGVFVFAGLVFHLIFGRDILQMYQDLKAAKEQRKVVPAAPRTDRAYVPAPAQPAVVGSGNLVPG